MPNEGWAVFTLVCFWGWVAAAILLSLACFTGPNLPFPRRAAACGSSFLLLFVLWVFGMLHT